MYCQHFFNNVQVFQSGKVPASTGPASLGGVPGGRSCFCPGLEQQGGNGDGMKGSCATRGPASTVCKKIVIFSATSMMDLATLMQALEAGEAEQEASAWGAKQAGVQ